MKATAEQQRMSDLLTKAGIVHYLEYRVSHPTWPCTYSLDIFVPQYRVDVEIDGPYHLGRQFYDDLRNERLRRDLGIRTLRVTNFDVRSNERLIIGQIKAFIYTR